MELESIKILENLGIEYDLIELSGRSVTVDDVVKNAEKDIDSDEVCKTIVVKGVDEGDFFGVILKGIDEIDFSVLEDILDQEVETASLDELRELTGKDPGEISPVSLDLPLLIDEKVFESVKINFGSGDPSYGLEIFSEDLKKLDNKKLLNLSKD